MKFWRKLNILNGVLALVLKITGRCINIFLSCHAEIAFFEIFAKFYFPLYVKKNYIRYARESKLSA